MSVATGYCHQISILCAIDIYFRYGQLYTEHASSFLESIGKYGERVCLFYNKCSNDHPVKS